MAAPGRLRAAIFIGLWAASLSFLAPLAEDAMGAFGAKPAGQSLNGPCDFVAFWAAGRLARQGEAPAAYVNTAMLTAEDHVRQAHGLHLLWLYPPPAFLLAWPASILPFPVAFPVWIVALILASVFILRNAGLPWPVIAAASFSPAALLNTDLGQVGLFAGALLMSGILLADRAPVAAGAMFSALIFKPQAAILAPVVLLARSRWGGILCGAIGGVLLSLLATALCGLEAWWRFYTLALPSMHYILSEPFPHHAPPVAASDELYGISVFWMFRSLGAGIAASWAAQFVTSAISAGLCWRAWRRPVREPVALCAFTMCLSLLATPYGYMYDLCGVSIAVGALIYQTGRLAAADILLWSWPVLGLIIAFHFFVEITPVVLALTAWRAARVNAAGRNQR